LTAAQLATAGGAGVSPRRQAKSARLALIAMGIDHVVNYRTHDVMISEPERLAAILVDRCRNQSAPAVRP